jgi:hypothetical protein
VGDQRPQRPLGWCGQVCAGLICAPVLSAARRVCVCVMPANTLAPQPAKTTTLPSTTSPAPTPTITPVTVHQGMLTPWSPRGGVRALEQTQSTRATRWTAILMTHPTSRCASHLGCHSHNIQIFIFSNPFSGLARSLTLTILLMQGEEGR